MNEKNCDIWHGVWGISVGLLDTKRLQRRIACLSYDLREK